MSHQQKQLELTDVLPSSGPYPIEAYNFVREGLGFTVQHVQETCPGGSSAGPSGGSGSADPDRHISGQELCLGLRDFAIERYGLLAPVVLEHWHIRRTDDFGRIVFAMIHAGLMSKTDEDSPEDFRAVYHFSEAFSRDELMSRIGTGF